MRLGIGHSCTLCPRRCHADRESGRHGYCGAPAGPLAAAVCLHRGEEPPISGSHGIVNVFFAHCPLQCVYCQNHAISGRHVDAGLLHFDTLEAIADRVAALLPRSSGLLGLVTASHYAHLVEPLLDMLWQRGLHPTVVYNSSGYEDTRTLRSLEGLIDIYLPYFKYSSPDLAKAYSNAADYPDTARAAILEMRRQVGSGLKVHDGVAYRGLIVRHLVLPGAVRNSVGCLDWLADQFPVGLRLSLMAQYFPPRQGLPAPLDRCVEPQEYAAVLAHAASLGLDEGWQQSLEAGQNYRPDFAREENPFEQ